MSANQQLSSDQIMALAVSYSSLGDAARDVLRDPTIVLTQDQSNLIASDMTQCYGISGNLATWAVQVIFADSDSAFQSIIASTQSGSAAVVRLKAEVAKINSIMNILGAAVSLGISFGTGNWVSVMSAANNLGNAIADG